MFTKFVGVSKSQKTSASPSRAPKTKRSQVSRACAYCRSCRIKCDDCTPCSNCQIKRVKCVKEKTRKSGTRKKLDCNSRSKLDNAEQNTSSPSTEDGELEKECSPFSTGMTKSPAELPITIIRADLTPTSSKDDNEPSPIWKDLRIVDPLTKSIKFYGPSSTLKFQDRISTFLSTALREPITISDISPDTSLPTTVHARSISSESTSTGLSRGQEELFLGMFWQSYYCLIPTICEKEFNSRYNWLWSSAEKPQIRNPCPLVDIVLSLSIQYSRTFIPPNEGSSSEEIIDPQDAIYVSVWYYRRCRTLLEDEWEHPTCTTLQCYIFVIIYLRNANYNTMAYTALGVAVQIGYSLGFHLEPDNGLPRAEQELHRRLWWTLCSLDTELSIELGRPFAVSMSEVTCEIPSCDISLARLARPDLEDEIEGITWLSFVVQYITLLKAVRVVHSEFYSRSRQLNSMASTSDDIYLNPAVLESCASILIQCIHPLTTWLSILPSGLLTPRLNSGTPFSVDGIPLLISPDTTPRWLLLQRISLELLYHNLLTALHRPFISFHPQHPDLHPLSTALARTSLSHSLTITSHLHTMFTSSSILKGWYDAYHIQYSACLTTIAYILAYPFCDWSPAARRSMEMGLRHFENSFGFNCPTAWKTAVKMRALDGRVRWLMKRFVGSGFFVGDGDGGREGVAGGVERGGGTDFFDSTVVAVDEGKIILGNYSSLGLWNDGLGETSTLDAWPDLEGCHFDMWVGFLAQLEETDGTVDGVGHYNSV